LCLDKICHNMSGRYVRHFPRRRRRGGGGLNIRNRFCNYIKKKTPWCESTSKLYRPSDRRLSAKCCQLVRIEGATWSA
jgi:hypothetical protein